jgi:hypothetical protein
MERKVLAHCVPARKPRALFRLSFLLARRSRRFLCGGDIALYAVCEHTHKACRLCELHFLILAVQSVC